VRARTWALLPRFVPVRSLGHGLVCSVCSQAQACVRSSTMRGESNDNTRDQCIQHACARREGNMTTGGGEGATDSVGPGA
jgi:hypothetical protein